jgi:translation initiation factor IF-1
VELLPNVTFRLELEVNRAQVIGHAAGAAKANFVRLRLNDKVLVELASHDKTRGRIVKVL